MFTTFFTLEAVLKLTALSKDYFASGWNIFDLIIVIASLIDLSVESVNGISVLRGMRLVSIIETKTSFFLSFSFFPAKPRKVLDTLGRLDLLPNFDVVSFLFLEKLSIFGGQRKHSRILSLNDVF